MRDTAAEIAALVDEWCGAPVWFHGDITSGNLLVGDISRIEILRGLRIVHQHKMLHLDIKPANIFITNENKAVLLDFGAAREVLSKEGNFIRPMYTPGFAAPEMYRRDGTLGPWTDIYAIGACIYACMQGYPPNDAPQRIEKDRLALSLSARLPPKIMPTPDASTATPAISPAFLTSMSW